MKILNFGSLNLDYVYSVDQFVRPGETKSSKKREVFAGGKGLNQSIALARSGVEVYHAGAVGKSDGNILIEVLKKNNINTEFIREIDDISTGHAIIQVNNSGENCILLFGGANHKITTKQIDETLEEFSKGDFLILQNEINMMEYIVEKAHKKGLNIVLNPSPIEENIFKINLDFIDYFILNEIEALDISKQDKIENILEILGKKYPSAKIVLTLGERGVKFKCGDSILKHGIFDVPVVDTTGAGDTFTGYFIGSLVQGYSNIEALSLASRASAIAVSKMGAETSIPFMKEVQNSKLKLK